MATARIDVHAHFLPDFYREALLDAGIPTPDGMPGIPAWNAAAAIAAMDALDIAAAIVSISSPGIHFGDAAAAVGLARRVNDEAARLRDAYPRRFAFFASVPLPDIDAAIVEAIRALDELGAAGIAVESNHHGMYLGDERLAPFYAALNARAAVLFVHPTSPTCVGCVGLALGYPRPMLEFMFETTRSITNLILSGMTLRYRDLRFIVPHAGAALPVLASRIAGFSALVPQDAATDKPDFRAELRTLYFDLAGMPLPELLPALRSVADPSRIFYGSDWPFTPLEGCKALANALDATAILDDPLRVAVMRANAVRLFPALA